MTLCHIEFRSAYVGFGVGKNVQVEATKICLRKPIITVMNRLKRKIHFPRTRFTRSWRCV